MRNVREQPVRARLTASDNLKLADEGVYTTGTLTIVKKSSGGGGGAYCSADCANLFKSKAIFCSP